jgi:hypothetical protein
MRKARTAKVRISALAAAVGLLLASAASEVKARQAHGGSGGRSVGTSFSAHAGGGGARFATSVAGFSVAARATHLSVPRVSFNAGHAPAHRSVARPAHVSIPRASFSAVAQVKHHQLKHHFASTHAVSHRRSRHGAYVAGFAPVAYGFVGRSYGHCAWMRVRYEETGHKKWWHRYIACRDGDDD